MTESTNAGEVRVVRGRALIRVVWAMLALMVVSSASAQPVRREVLSDVEAASRGDGFRLTVKFALPVSYLSHVPMDTGDTILIHIKPIVLDAAGSSGLSHREALAPPPEAPDYLTDIVYDGEDECSRYLVLHFSRKVSFRVSQGGDMRSLVIDIRPAGAQGSSPNDEKSPAAPAEEGHTSPGSKPGRARQHPGPYRG
ncbi:MAG TPA: hypothetical protein VKA50_05690 [Gammaproteobacteria bacterium]|nr:hypothetical protein [Gammaproteobacteria bacterium]